MPLPYPSQSHGRIAFGFYNIESDGLLLESLFFFCTDFCRAVTALIAAGTAEMPGHVFDDAAAIGDLHGAIAGDVLVGYLGAVYRRWPFPRNPEAFRQNPRSHATQAEVLPLLDRFARRTAIHLRRDAGEIAVGDYRFTPHQFDDLVAYVLRGGYPRWTDEAPPEHVTAMTAAWSQR